MMTHIQSESLCILNYFMCSSHSLPQKSTLYFFQVK